MVITNTHAHWYWARLEIYKKSESQVEICHELVIKNKPAICRQMSVVDYHDFFIFFDFSLSSFKFFIFSYLLLIFYLFPYSLPLRSYILAPLSNFLFILSSFQFTSTLITSTHLYFHFHPPYYQTFFHFFFISFHSKTHFIFLSGAILFSSYVFLVVIFSRFFRPRSSSISAGDI